MIRNHMYTRLYQAPCQLCLITSLLATDGISHEGPHFFSLVQPWRTSIYSYLKLQRFLTLTNITQSARWNFMQLIFFKLVPSEWNVSSERMNFIADLLSIAKLKVDWTPAFIVHFGFAFHVWWACGAGVYFLPSSVTMCVCDVVLGESTVKLVKELRPQKDDFERLRVIGRGAFGEVSPKLASAYGFAQSKQYLLEGKRARRWTDNGIWERRMDSTGSKENGKS